MTIPEPLHSILKRIAQHHQTAEDLKVLSRSLHQEGKLLQWVSQDGKFNVNIGEIVGGQVHIGDRTTLSDEQIQAIAQAIREQLPQPPATSELPAVDDLVQQVRSRIHDDIQRLHGTMPLWGVDHWVPLGELFVDVNILEEVSSNRRSELADLWQDFSQNPGYRSLDRMGLGKKRQRVSGLAVLTRNTNLMVVGKPGSGKTTYLQRVVTECNACNLQAQRIPVLIRLREFVEDGRGVDYAVERYLEWCWRLSAIEVQSVLDAGRSLVLLDGLDEVTGADGQAIAKQIKRFARDYPQVQVIVTCRTQSQESRFERFDSVEVADFNEPQVRAFAKHWFQTVCGDLTVGQTKAKAFLDQLFREENKAIRELAITPILLSLTCAVFQQKQAFYSKRSKLYEEGLELLLEKWDRSREIERDEVYRDLSVERKLELLSYLAVKKFEQEQYVLFEQAEIEGYIGEFLGIGVRESRGVLRAIESQHGLLIERSQKIWSFSHLTFQEYLVAKWFYSQTGSTNLFNATTDHYWREVFLLITEMSPNVEEFLLVMKSEIDLLPESSPMLTNFLTWLYSKFLIVETEIKTPYSPAIVRAFYFELCLLHFFSHHGLAIRAGLPIGSVIRDVMALDSCLIHTFNEGTCWLGGRDCFLGDVENIVSNFVKVFEVNCCQNAYEDNLRQFLEHLRDQLPSSDEDLDACFRWWAQNGRIWLSNLYKAIDYRKLMWINGNQLNEEEKNHFRKYHTLNWLLLDCLNSSYLVTSNTRQEIQETLLLPIVEIEKRTREKVE